MIRICEIDIGNLKIRAAAGIGLYVNAHKTEYMCYNQTGDISTLDGTPLKLVDKFTYLGSSVASTEKDIDTRLTKAWTAINRLSIILKSDRTDKMKRSFFQAAVASILLYGCTTWTLIKRLEKKKLDGNYTRMLRAILNKSWWQHPTRHQLYGLLPPITKTIQVRWVRHAGHCWRSRNELISRLASPSSESQPSCSEAGTQLWLFSNPKIPQPMLPVHDVIYTSWFYFLSGFFFFFDISEWHILSACAWTPALMLHLTNPCAKRKVLSLTKLKGKIYKTKSLGNCNTKRNTVYIFLLFNG